MNHRIFDPMIYAIVGMGRSGLAAQHYLERRGFGPDEIATFDSKPGAADFHDPKILMSRKPRVLVVSPGVPLSTPWIQEAAAKGVKITSEISLACEVLTSEKIIGVTGSVGKSTTVALLGEGARVMDAHAFVGGNFGIPFCEYAAGVLGGRRPRARWVILELSSFQLENSQGLHLDLAAITSLTSNHLERYRDREHYYETKASIRDLTRGSVFVNRHGEDAEDWLSHHSSGWVFTDPSLPFLRELGLSHSRLLGDHNQDNLALAASLALAAQWSRAAIEKMKSFPGLSHRLEEVGIRNGVRFINDSKATAISSVLIATKSALKAAPPENQVHLLLGGRDKNLPWQELSELSKNPSLSVLFFGECGPVAKEKSGLSGPGFPKLKDAFEAARKSAKPGDFVLLSPGGTSLDEFKSFEHRGDFFRELVQSS